MFFRNLQVYRFSSWPMTADRLDTLLAAQAFTPCGGLDMESAGWVPPRDGGRYVHAVGKQWLITLRIEKKHLPRSFVKQVVDERAAELEEEQGYRLGRAQMRELKEKVTDELLPQAFPLRKEIRAWIDMEHGWLVLDTAQGARADNFYKILLRSVQELPFRALRVNRSPAAAMTEWLQRDEAPNGFSVDQDVELSSKGQGGGKVRYVKQTPQNDEVLHHIGVGKQCTRLALSWGDRISFDLTAGLAIKRLRPLAVLKEKPAPGDDEAEQFDASLALMAGELDGLLTQLVEALGGEEQEKAAA